ncbi:MAG TPA: glycosyltransferase [Solirubrobacteraceae bacterium]|nr:glycosyltransferase [Solirubrobacteraceae bacterium]
MTDAIGPYHRGGKERRYLELAHRLAVRADVHVYTMNWWRGGPVRYDRGVTYHAISPLLPLYSGRRRSIRQAVVFAVCCLRLLFVRFDVIEADHMPYMQLLPLRLVATLRRRRLVVTWHECWGPAYWRDYLGRAGAIGWFCERVAMGLPDTIIADVPQTAARLGELGCRVPVVVVPIGIDLAAITDIVGEDHGVDVVTVGRLLPHKRLDLLLRALAMLRERGRPLRARIVGNGPELDSLRALGAELEIDDLLEFRQDVTSQEVLYAMIKSARAAVFPSEREGFGIAVLEALACGVPVVATSAPDNLARHLVERAEGAGVVCDPTAPALADAIIQLLDRPGDDAGVLDLDWLREYDWDAISDSVAAVLS